MTFQSPTCMCTRAPTNGKHKHAHTPQYVYRRKGLGSSKLPGHFDSDLSEGEPSFKYKVTRICSQGWEQLAGYRGVGNLPPNCPRPGTHTAQLPCAGFWELPYSFLCEMLYTCSLLKGNLEKHRKSSLGAGSLSMARASSMLAENPG